MKGQIIFSLNTPIKDECFDCLQIGESWMVSVPRHDLNFDTFEAEGGVVEFAGEDVIISFSDKTPSNLAEYIALLNDQEAMESLNKYRECEPGSVALSNCFKGE